MFSLLPHKWMRFIGFPHAISHPLVSISHLVVGGLAPPPDHGLPDGEYPEELLVLPPVEADHALLVAHIAARHVAAVPARVHRDQLGKAVL